MSFIGATVGTRSPECDSGLLSSILGKPTKITVKVSEMLNYNSWRSEIVDDGLIFVQEINLISTESGLPAE